MTTSVSDRWRLSGGGRLQWRSWADEHVVYDEASGDTHLLDRITASVLHRLQEQPASLAELAGSRLFLDDPAELSDYLEGVLAGLRRLDLIELV